jgi:ubiquinone/menaquinone biosynthesis C-methylase UbiE
MAQQVGSGGAVWGLDTSESMLALARSHCASSLHTAQITLVQGDAGALPFPDEAFDVAVATQVYCFLGELSLALAELYRVLRPGGRALLLETDWDSVVWHATDQTRMHQLLAIWCERFTDPYLPRTLSRQVREVGFQISSREVLPFFNPEYDPNTFSARQMEALGEFAVGRDGLTRADIEAWKTDLRQLGQEGCYFFSLNRYLFLVSKPTHHPIPSAF